MCGIFGVVDFQRVNLDVFDQMLRQLTHRGPDNVASLQVGSVKLGHTRLSIIDLHERANQPMASECGRYTLVFNGEIYNYQNIQQQYFPGRKFNSDTAVLLELIALKGVHRAVSELNGMFAFAVIDKQKKKLHLARDRFGEKPLYYGNLNGIFVFTSELKPIAKSQLFELNVEEQAVAQYFLRGYVPTPFSIFKNISKLTPGTVLDVAYERSLNLESTFKYWSPSDDSKIGLENLSKSNQHETIEEMIENSISSRLVADVPVGVFLSGGIDSSLVAAVAARHSNDTLKSFSIGFNEAGYDESKKAEAIALHLGLEHTTKLMTSDDAQNVIPLLPQIWDEPFSDSSQIPTFFVSELAKKDVTVALTGDGGDEVFGGYNRYGKGYDIFQTLVTVPKMGKSILNFFLKGSSVFSKHDMSLFYKISKFGALNNKIEKLIEVLHSTSLEDYYNRLTTNQIDLLPLRTEYKTHIKETNTKQSIKHVFNMQIHDREKLMLADVITYLPDDILVKVDRASMAVSLETRAPFLDHLLYDAMKNVSVNNKVNSSGTKLILRQMLKKYLPPELVSGSKKGFGIPLDHWLRNDLNEWMKDTLLSETASNYYDITELEKIINEFETGNSQSHHTIWTLLMYESWRTNWNK